MSSETERHWNTVYDSKRAEEVSWFQSHAGISLELTRQAMPDRSARILDVGGGASHYVDDLLVEGYRNITVLDLVPAGLAIARARLGSGASTVGWVEADALHLPFRSGSIDFWHDRAVLHFLTEPEQRRQYVDQVRRTVRPGGYVMVATFARDGPPQCSGLPVARYEPGDLHATFGAGFGLVASRREMHRTPRGATQPFTYCLCRLGGER